MKILFTILLILHGLIHLLGFIKAFNLSTVEALTLPITKFWGGIWLLAFLLFVVAAGLYVSQKNAWWLLAIIGVFVSQVLILIYWKDAKFGSLANIIILAVSVVGYAQYDFYRMVQREVASIASPQIEPADFLDEAQIKALPAPVQRWLYASGMAGQRSLQHIALEQNFKLKLKTDQKEWYQGTAHQEVWTEIPAFIWTLDLQMMPLVHVSGRDLFAEGKGKMLIKMMSLVSVVDEANNPKINQGALQRYLAEMLWYPSLALSEHVSWKAVNDHTATATMNYGGTTGDCTFFFNPEGMPERISAMRYRGGDENAQLTEWVIDVQEFQMMEGIRIPVKCAVTWKLDEGDWTWAELEVTDYSWE